MSVLEFLRRELRIAFSTKAQSVRFRLTKWSVILVAGWMLWDWPWFGILCGSAFAFGIALHLFWRYKTKGWTQPWGGWNDIR